MTIVDLRPLAQELAEAEAIGDRLKLLEGLKKLIAFINSPEFAQVIETIKKIFEIFKPVQPAVATASDLLIEGACAEAQAAGGDATAQAFDLATLVAIVKFLIAMWRTFPGTSEA